MTMAENVCYIDRCVMVRWTVRMARMNRDVVSLPKNSSTEINSSF